MAISAAGSDRAGTARRRRGTRWWHGGQVRGILPGHEKPWPETETMFGHPRGLFVLFFTELWERFSFYGMKTLLLLYMINHFFWSQEDASSLLGTYAMLAYGMPVVGGFIADRWLGAKRAVLLGAALLSLGHLTMAFENRVCFYAALGLIITGVGLLKPNVSTQVGSLYKPGDPRRDGAFTIFYMGINLGALIGPLLCDWLRVTYGYSYGFGAAGVGMILGMIVYFIGQRRLVEFKQDAPDDAGEKPEGSAAAVVHPRHVVRDRIIVLLVVFAFIILFWTAFEQSPNAMLVWADKHTNLRLLSTECPPVSLDAASAVTTEEVGWWQQVKDWGRDPTMTSGQTQSFNPFFIITLAPVFAFIWLRMGRRGLEPSTPTKMVMGLALVVCAFAIMFPAAVEEGAPSSAPLAALPASLSVDDDGRVYSPEQQEKTADERVYYGAARLRYDATAAALRLGGVLTDLDRFRLLAKTAPDDFAAAVNRFAETTASQPSREEHVAQLRLAEVVKNVVANLDRFRELAQTDMEQCSREISLLVSEATATADEKANEGWSLATVIECAPPGIGPVQIKEGEGKTKKTILTWDPDAKLLTAYGEIKQRARTEFLATAAQADFKAAVDKIFVESSRFKVTVWWLIAFYLLLTMGELCLSPVGLSLVTKLAPPKHVGLFMGGWFLATAVAEKLAQEFGAYWGKMPPADYFVIFVVMCGVGCIFMGLLIRPLKRRMHGVQ
jgi:POT family proton-dependent oligopeptide transporter